MGNQLKLLLQWVDDRYPLMVTYRYHMSEYWAPKNFNFWYFFGSLALLVLANQLITGIFLTMHYKPDATLNASGIPIAFASVEYIMRDVPWGWLIRYMHSTGASAFFIVVYMHMFRGLLYGSYRKPRELLWVFGVVIYLALMGEAFFGYLLPWGQMSGWGAQVILNLPSAIPVVGKALSTWIRGDYVVSDATLNRAFAFHVIAIPLALLGLVFAHLVALHDVGSNNPDGIEIKKHKDAKGIPLDGIAFHPYYTIKDITGSIVFLAVFFFIICYLPEGGGYFLESNNFLQFDPMKTPPHIAPVWYFTPYYSVLRATTQNVMWVFQLLTAGTTLGFMLAIRNGFGKIIVAAVGAVAVAAMFILEAKFWGVVFFGLSVMMFFFLPWLDRSPVKSIRYKGPLFKTALAIFVIAFIMLGVLGTQPPDKWSWGPLAAQISTVVYFLFYLLMPIYSKLDKTKPEPDRVT